MTGSAFRGALTGSATYGLGKDTLRLLGVPDAGAGFVLHHITNTMLGRQLMFFFDGAMLLRCDAEMGRLLAFSVFEPSGATRSSHLFGDRDDIAATERTLAAFEETLACLCAGAEEISVRCDRLRTAGGIAQAGLPVEQLALRLGLVQGQVDAGTRLRGFFERAQHVIPAAAMSNGHRTDALKGSDADVKRLLHVAADLSRNVDAAEGMSGSSSRWRLLIIAAADRAEDEYLLAEYDDHTFTAITGRDDTPTLVATWLGCMRF